MRFKLSCLIWYKDRQDLRSSVTKVNATPVKPESLLVPLSSLNCHLRVQQKFFPQCFSVRSENNTLPTPVLTPVFRGSEKKSQKLSLNICLP